MANCLEITLWYPEDKFNALSTALEPAGSSVEEELGRVLTELYERLVPSEQRVEIAEKLAREEQHEAEERVRHEAETYRVSVLKLTAGRACEMCIRDRSIFAEAPTAQDETVLVKKAVNEPIVEFTFGNPVPLQTPKPVIAATPVSTPMPKAAVKPHAKRKSAKAVISEDQIPLFKIA